MSAKLFGRVWDYDLKANLQAVLLVLADHAHDDGTHCYPSVGKIAWKLGSSERTAQRLLRKLEEMNVLECVENALGGRGNHKEYVIHLEVLPLKKAFVPKRQRNTGENCTPDITENQKGDNLSCFGNEAIKGDNSCIKGDNFDVKGDKAVSPEPYNHITNNTPLISPQGENPLVDVVLNFKPTERYLADLSARFGVAEGFISFLLERWREVAAERAADGARIRSCASNFETFIKQRKDNTQLRNEWFAEQREGVAAAEIRPVKAKLTDEEIYLSAEGQHALQNQVASNFYRRCIAANAIQGMDVVQALIAELTERRTAEKDKAAQISFNASMAREEGLRGKWLNKEGAVA